MNESEEHEGAIWAEPMFGELISMRPQMFRWVSTDESAEAHISLNHVIGFQVIPESESEFAANVRMLYVTVANAETLYTDDQGQIDRFLDQWEIV